jgi:hypothetical protein
MFAEEKPHLTPLPVEPFRYYKFGDRTVHLDNHIEVEGAYYQAPPGTIHDKVHVQWDGVHVRLISKETGLLLREYLRQHPGGYRGREEERHPDPIPASTRQLLVRAKRAGKKIGAVALAMHTRDGEVCVRRIFGLLALAKKRGIAAVDDACGIALEMGAPTYRAVKRYLDHRPPVQLTLSQVDPLIRELTEYRDLVDRMTNKETTE